ncbi:MAG TPA: peptidylprolyl isomerase [Candidatus Wallbacteria bacterium]|nr:peptidylprolyl isomerase [Candidatus Wallbacteria bacterium]
MFFILCGSYISLAYDVDQNPDVKFENHVRQIVAEEVNRAFEKYGGAGKNTLKPEELSNVLIPIITDQVVKRSIPLITGTGAAAASQNPENSLVLAKIKNKKITASEAVEEYLKLPQNSRVFLNTFEKLKSFLTEVVLVNQIVVMEAEKKGLASRDEIKIQIEKAFENLLIESYYKQIKDEIIKAINITDAQISAFYEENKQRFQIKDCVTLANIFVKFNPEDTNSIQLARNKIEKAKMELDLGTHFEKVWEKHSDDKTHKNGVLGTFRRDMYNNNSIINEAFSRNLGEYTNIIRGNNGFYILKVLEKNDSKTVPLSDVKNLIEGELKNKIENDRLEEWLKTVKAKYNIKIYRDKIGGAADTLEIGQPSGALPLDIVSADKTAGAKEPKAVKASAAGGEEKKSEKVSEENGSKNGKPQPKKNDRSSRKKSSSKKTKTASKKDKKSSADKSSNGSEAVAREEKKSDAAALSVKSLGDLNEVFAEVDGVKITRLNYNESISQLPSFHKSDFNKYSDRLAIVEKIINRIILKKEAGLAQIQNSPAFKKEMKDIENKILARALIFEEVTKKIADPSLKELKEYHAKNNSEFQVRHILIAVKNQNDQNELDAARQKAMSVFDKIDTQDFVQLARQYSDDVSKNDGGLLPPFTYDDMVEGFSDAVVKLKPGGVSRPVLTSFGFHIIKLEQVKPLVFNEVKNKIKEKLIGSTQKKALMSYIESLKESYAYELNEEGIQKAIEQKIFQR